MKTIRPASFAGSWYPASATACEKEIQAFLKETGFPEIPAANYIGGIVPHAGWYFSGSLACRAIHALRGQHSQPEPDVVAVFGMHMHRVICAGHHARGGMGNPVRGNSHCRRTGRQSHRTVFPFKRKPRPVSPRTTPSNSSCHSSNIFSLPPGSCPLAFRPPESLLILPAAWCRPRKKQTDLLKIIGSTDLTHYGPNYGFAPSGSGKKAVEWVRNKNDKNAIDRMLAMDPEKLIADSLASGNACCSRCGPPPPLPRQKPSAPNVAGWRDTLPVMINIPANLLWAMRALSFTKAESPTPGISSFSVFFTKP